MTALNVQSQKTEGGESEAKAAEAKASEGGEQQGDESVQVETEDDEAKESAADEEEEQPKKPKFEQDTAPTLTDVDIEAMGVTVEKNVFKLNISNFYQVVNNTRYMLINFYAPW